MLNCGTPVFAVATLFFIGIIVGVVAILCLRFRGVSFKKKYGFKDTEMIKLGKTSHGKELALHSERKETVDGAGALNEFNRK